MQQPGATGAEATTLVTVGGAIVSTYNWSFLLGQSLMPALNAIMLGTLLYRSGLVPRILPVIGLIGAPLLIATTVATLFGVVVQYSSIAVLSAVPIGCVGDLARPVADVQGLQVLRAAHGRGGRPIGQSGWIGNRAAFRYGRRGESGCSVTATELRSGPFGSPHPGDKMSSPRHLARIAGVFYLMVGIFGGFAEGFVDPKLYVAGDAAATAGNVAANSELARMGVVAHLVDGVFFALTAMALYLLLGHVQKTAARLMVLFVALAVGMICLNAVFLFEGMQVATDPSYLAAFGIAGSSALVMVLLDIQHYGTLAAQVFFGLWLVPLGYLAYRSGLFPKVLGVVLVVAAVSYVADTFAAFLLPDLEQQIKPFLIDRAPRRRDLDGRLPAGQGCEDRSSGRSCARGRPCARPVLTSRHRRATPANPWKKLRWSTRNSSSGGRITIAMPAKVSPWSVA